MSAHTLYPRHRVRKRRFSGLSQRQERVFYLLSASIILTMMLAWTIAIIDLHVENQRERYEANLPRPGGPAATPSGSSATGMPSVTRTVTSSILDSRAPKTTYLDQAALEFLDPLRGSSGSLKAAFRTPGTAVTPAVQDGTLHYEAASGHIAARDFRAPAKPGIYKLAVEINRARRQLDDLSLVTLVPFNQKKEGKIGLYYLGSWPFEGGGTPRTPQYANPNGFIEVTAQNKSFHVSEHFRLQDFLTKDQPNVWPKYLLLDPKLIDKLELIVQEIERQGRPVDHVFVMSGFRTPRYNKGGGNTGGRANLSRHMYGDAADIWVDNDRNGLMDDLNRDGRVDRGDAEYIANAAERVERQHPALVGGVGIYAACCGHGPFTHIDVRGHRARWHGTGNG